MSINSRSGSDLNCLVPFSAVVVKTLILELWNCNRDDVLGAFDQSFFFHQWSMLSQVCSRQDTCLQNHHTLCSSCLFRFPHHRGQNCLPCSLMGTLESGLQGSFSCVQLTAGNWMHEHLVWKWKEFNESGVFMGLVFLAAIISRGCTEGQKLSFCGVNQTSPSDKIKLMWLLVLISKAAGFCNVFGMADIGGRERTNRGFIIMVNVWWF